VAFFRTSDEVVADSAISEGSVERKVRWHSETSCETSEVGGEAELMQTSSLA
jgi:hypothetical protein